MKLEVGDYVLITGHRMIAEFKWKETWPQNQFGKILEIRKRYNPDTGKRLPDKITVRIYGKGERWHSTPEIKYIQKL